MQINLDTNTAKIDELTALIALLHSLGGRLPGTTIVVNNSASFNYADIQKEMVARGDKTERVAGVVEEAGHFPSLDDVPLPPTARNVAETGVALISPEDAGIELDADGIPWDERIHASTKTRTKQDVWTKKRNVDEVLYGQVHAELQERYAVGKDEEVPPPPSDTSAENAPTVDTDVPPPPAPDVSAGSSAESGGFADFAELVAAVAPFNHPYVKLAELASKVSDSKVTKFPDLRAHPELWGAFFQKVCGA